MRKWILLTFLCMVNLSIAYAQQNYTISGVIKDKEGVLPGAGVYISGYKISTSANDEGKFILSNLAPGNYDVVVQMIGYLPFKKNVIISNQSEILNVTLSENAMMLREVVIKPDPNRNYYINLFKDFFLGKTPNSALCKLINPQVLIINDDKAKRLLSITADDFLIVENPALGYRIKYLLETFEYNYNTKIIYYAGHPIFEEMEGNRSKQNRWKKNREIAYNGSIQHFFKSLYQNKLNENGFMLYKLYNVPNKDRLPDSLISANIKRLTNGQKGITNLLTYRANDSLSYWFRQRNLPKGLSVIDKKEILMDTLVKSYNENLKMMNFNNSLYVIYKNEKESEAYSFSGHKRNRTPDLANYQISIIDLLEPPVRFYANGGIYDPRSNLYQGYWAYEKVGDLLPMDYIPTGSQ